MHISQRMDVSERQHRIGVMSISWAQVSITWLKRTDKLIFFFVLLDGGKCIMHVEKYEQEGAKGKENGSDKQALWAHPN